MTVSWFCHKCAGRTGIGNLDDIGHAVVGDEQIAVGVKGEAIRIDKSRTDGNIPGFFSIRLSPL